MSNNLSVGKESSDAMATSRTAFTWSGRDCCLLRRESRLVMKSIQICGRKSETCRCRLFVGMIEKSEYPRVVKAKEV